METIEQKMWLSSEYHCTSCGKNRLTQDRFMPFFIIIGNGQFAKTPPVIGGKVLQGQKEPIVIDGIFNDRGKIAQLQACPPCYAKIRRWFEHYTEADSPARFLHYGPLLKMVEQIYRRHRNRIVQAWIY